MVQQIVIVVEAGTVAKMSVCVAGCQWEKEKHTPPNHKMFSEKQIVTVETSKSCEVYSVQEKKNSGNTKKQTKKKKQH